MSICAPSRRLGSSAIACLSNSHSPLSISYSTRRHVSNDTKPSEAQSQPEIKKEAKDTENLSVFQRNLLLNQRKLEREGLKHPGVKLGSLGKDSIFTDTTTPRRRIRPSPVTTDPQAEAELLKREDAQLRAAEAEEKQEMKEQQEYDLTRLRLDPHPHARRQWEARKVIQSIRKRGRLTKPEKLLRTERQHLYKSPVLDTSTKKLTKLAHQIQGKTVDEALVQMRFSKKKVAQDVIRGLEIARNEAIVARGMGLGRAEQKRDAVSEVETKQPESQKSTQIELKNGKTKTITDPSQIYVDQAWVNVGPSSFSLETRARGRQNRLIHRSTSFSVLLKEEATRIRISDEIKKKRDNRKLWTALPNRPITEQRQYYLW